MKKEAGYRPPTIRIRKNVAKMNWQPSTWQPEYETIVAMSCRGFSNAHIADKFGLTPTHISNILRTNEAKEIKSQFVQVVRAESMKVAEDQFTEMHNRALENMHSVLTNADLLKDAPFAVFDRSKSFLTGIGKLKSDNAAGNTTNNIMITDELGKRILAGITKSQESKALHQGISGESIN